MYTLNLIEESSEKILLLGDIQLENKNLKLDFKIDAAPGLINFNNTNTPHSPASKRTHKLWENTCFEAFWSLPSSMEYWEFNIAFNGLWNLYYFKSYRNPNIPQENFDFQLIDFNSSTTMINVVLKCNLNITDIEASLTSIIKTHSNKTLYFATHHYDNKPDFHIRKSFQLKRSIYP
jgi:hypothetical protein